jgi:hypothetical protein
MAAACGERAGVIAGRPMKATVSDPCAGEGAFRTHYRARLFMAGRFIRHQQIPRHAPPRVGAPMRNSWEYARCQRARRPERQT